VSDVAAEFRRDQLIEYRYGRVRILDGRRLEQMACECYGVIRRHFARLEPKQG
jgi:hypothetical protein